MTTDIDSLIARVHAATGADREIDWDLHCLIYAEEERGQGYPKGYTSSLDAIVELIERELPTQSIDIIRAAISDLSRRFSWHTEIKTKQEVAFLPLACCLSFLLAFKAKQESK